MIIHLPATLADDPRLQPLIERYQPFRFIEQDRLVLITAASVKQPDPEVEALGGRCFVAESDIQLADKRYRPRRTVTLGGPPEPVQIGGDTNRTVIIAGPCSVETPEQIEAAAGAVSAAGVRYLRAGAYKPRTSPYSFQGLGAEGLKLLRQTADAFSMGLVTEVRDATHVEAVLEIADIIQIGAKAMYDHGILRACAAARKPILLKRSFGATLQEFVQGAEFILSGGNGAVMLCERGIRSFETKTRFTLDLCGVAWLKQHVNLPVILDPSHAMGIAYGVPELARACVAQGVDGLLIEVHPTPAQAKSDAAQQLDFARFADLHKSLQPIAAAVGRDIV